MTRQALGKGLDALLPRVTTQSELLQIDLERIRPSEFQPRGHFPSPRLEELAASIAANGVLQPIVVRPRGEDYEIVAGERRWRAAQKANLIHIPAIVQDVNDEKMVELALVENIQRDDLNPLEEAHAYRLLMENFSLNQEEIGRRVGRSRAAVTNTLRLLQLPQAVQQYLLTGELSMGHARALIPLSSALQLSLAQQIASRGLSVREIERQVKRMRARPNTAPHKPLAWRDPNLRAAEEKLEKRWKTRVQIHRRGSAGQIRLHFHNEEELDRLYSELIAEASTASITRARTD